MKTFLVCLLLLTFSLFAVLANNITCYKCHARNSDYCKGEDHQCPAHSGCMTLYEKLECYGSFHSIKKRCAYDLPCNITMYAYSNESIFFGLATKCCHNDHCNDGVFEIPKISNETDGCLCPSCFAANTTEMCNAEKKTVCKGETDQCVQFIGSAKTPSGVEANFTGQGCMSKNACQFDFTTLIGIYVYNIKLLKCYDPDSEH
ncbi:uncharacterized protein [Aquarana catesbeiana]|uniref:uncharacterized protein n=1 Tax=Aquarana catesbeiana TaxID=8400 RepID=UPI003CCA3FAF